MARVQALVMPRPKGITTLCSREAAMARAYALAVLLVGSRGTARESAQYEMLDHTMKCGTHLCWTENKLWMIGFNRVPLFTEPAQLLVIFVP